MADLFVKQWPVGECYGSYGKRFYILELDEYELVNLRWMMDLIYGGRHKDVNLNNGDWCGQIRHALVEGTDGLPYTMQPPNADGGPGVPLA